MKEFVGEIKNQDFIGVSGRVNFNSGHSRRSEIRIMQWSLEGSAADGRTMNVNQIGEDCSRTCLTSSMSGLYKPNYLDENGSLEWFDGQLQWKTEDGMKPSDRDRRWASTSSSLS